MSEKIELSEVVREWPQYMQRVWVEKQEWDERVKRFGVSIGHSPLFAALDEIEQELLKEQYEIMWKYSEVLGKRLDHFCKAPSDDVLKKLNDDSGVVFVLPEFTPAIEKLMADNDTVRELLVYPVAPAVIATESMKDEPEDFYPATSSGISRTPNQALGELAGSVKRLVGHFKVAQVATTSAQRLDRFKKAAQPLIDYLRELGNPHAKAIVEPDYAELVEGALGFNADQRA